jgi:hypothetical protein
MLWHIHSFKPNFLKSTPPPPPPHTHTHNKWQYFVPLFHKVYSVGVVCGIWTIGRKEDRISLFHCSCFPQEEPCQLRNSGGYSNGLLGWYLNHIKPSGRNSRKPVGALDSHFHGFWWLRMHGALPQFPHCIFIALKRCQQITGWEHRLRMLCLWDTWPHTWAEPVSSNERNFLVTSL